MDGYFHAGRSRTFSAQRYLTVTHSNAQHSNDKRPQMRSTTRKVPAPALKAQDTERGLTHSPYFNGPLYERMSNDLHLGGMSGKGLTLKQIAS